MSNRYIVKYNDGSVQMTKPNSTLLIYRIPYSNLKRKNPGFIIPNRFIVYILVGKNPGGKDKIYVGKSKNGIDYRPTSHTNKCDDWRVCYVLTQSDSRTFFNDGTIQYLEDAINQRISTVDTFENTTINTNSDTANPDDMEDGDDYLAEAYKMLHILGLDLITNSEENLANDDIEAVHKTNNLKNIPDGIYHFSQRIKKLGNVQVKGKMQVTDGKLVLLAGSDVVMEAGIGLAPVIDEKRNSARIENGRLMEDVPLNSPSACGEFILGASCNGWINWKNDKGEPIEIYKPKKNF